MIPFKEYIAELNRQFKTGMAREHGYRPAQKWLKDRKGKALTYTELRHYQEIIHALTATIALMEKLD